MDLHHAVGFDLFVRTLTDWLRDKVPCHAAVQSRSSLDGQPAMTLKPLQRVQSDTVISLNGLTTSHLH
jgi:hypothetical protein